MTYIAHRSESGKIQTVKEHNQNVGKLAAEMAIPELSATCRESGNGHDIGKYQMKFQRRIDGEAIRVEHSICGAMAVIEKYGKNPQSLLMALCIAGHHGGIPDCGTSLDIAEVSTLNGRLKRETEDFSQYQKELPLGDIDIKAIEKLILKYCTTPEEVVECFAFLTRYCFSCVVDADTIDTMRAMENPPPQPLTANFEECIERLDKRLASFKPKTDLQKARFNIQKQAFQNIIRNADVYLMGTPTGSGKTLASLKCALERVRISNKKRVIYVIPYNSIIDQTVSEFEEILGESAQILRHQSSFKYETAEDISEDYRKSYIFACENWDAQIIVTTAVQFFESVYSNRRGKLRKLHNIADSVLVFDEAHLMPVEWLQACLRAVAFTTKILHSEALFLTATMPSFGQLMNQYALKTMSVMDIVPDKSEFKYFKKNTYKDLGKVSQEFLLGKAMESPSSLIVVNSRRTAKQLYEKCSGKKYHLSTYMTLNDRKRVIKEVRSELKNLYTDFPDMKDVPPERRIILIATSLVEAGIDFDFYTAFRELRGLDNLLQTGGRCNREGLFINGDVYSFMLDDCEYKYAEQNITLSIMRDYDDISSNEAVTEYFNRLFEAKKDEITKRSLYQMCTRLELIPFKTYSDNMHVIDSDTVSLIVPQTEECKKLIEKAKYTGFLETRILQDCCCSIYPKELEALTSSGCISDINGVSVLNDMAFYDSDTGVRLEGEAILYKGE